MNFGLVAPGVSLAKDSLEISTSYGGKWIQSDSTTTTDNQSTSKTTTIKFTFPPAPPGECVIYLAWQGVGQLTTFYNGALNYTIANPGRPSKVLSIDTSGQYTGKLTSAIQTQSFNCTGNSTNSFPPSKNFQYKAAVNSSETNNAESLPAIDAPQLQIETQVPLMLGL